MTNDDPQEDHSKRLALLVQSVTDYAIYMLSPEGFVRSWNAGAERFKGYAPNEIIGEHFSRFYTPQDLEAGVPRIALATAESVGRFEAEGWRVRKDGTLFWAHVVIDAIRDPSGELVGFAKITRDLSERKAAEEDLRKSEERFRLLIQSVTDYAIYMLDLEGHVTSWNPGAERFKGYRQEEIIGQHFSRFYTDEEREIGVPAAALRTAREKGKFEAEGWRVRKDGTRFWASVVIDPVRTPEGELIGFAKITRDLTERKKAHEELEQTRERFVQSQKMEAIGKLTGGVAHDFNNLLSVILGSLHLAERRLSEGGDASKLIANAIAAAERGANLTQRMLAFARKQDLKIERVDLADLVRGMAELLERTIGPGVQIETRFPLTLPSVQADARQLELALMNLIVNSRDAMQRGTITISAKREIIEAGGELSAGEYVRLVVADQGEGMDESTLSRAIEPFFTTKGIGKGTGLGLPMVHGLAQQSGGMFTIQSEVGKGTTAELWLPMSTANKEKRRIEIPQQRPEAASPLRILAVDDDLLVLSNTVTMLHELGHTVLAASSGKEALEVLGEAEIDLLLTDYAMPVMTGDELAKKAKDKCPLLSVLMVSGYADLAPGVASDTARLAKPFSEHALASAIARVAEGRLDAGSDQVN